MKFYEYIIQAYPGSVANHLRFPLPRPWRWMLFTISSLSCYRGTVAPWWSPVKVPQNNRKQHGNAGNVRLFGFYQQLNVRMATLPLVANTCRAEHVLWLGTCKNTGRSGDQIHLLQLTKLEPAKPPLGWLLQCNCMLYKYIYIYISICHACVHVSYNYPYYVFISIYWIQFVYIYIYMATHSAILDAVGNWMKLADAKFHRSILIWWIIWAPLGADIRRQVSDWHSPSRKSPHHPMAAGCSPEVYWRLSKYDGLNWAPEKIEKHSNLLQRRPAVTPTSYCSHIHDCASPTKLQFKCL